MSQTPMQMCSTARKARQQHKEIRVYMINTNTTYKGQVEKVGPANSWIKVANAKVLCDDISSVVIL